MIKQLRCILTGLLLVLGSSLMMAQGDWNPSNPPEPSAKYKITVSSSPDFAYTSGTGWYSQGQQVWIYSSAYSTNYKFKYWTKNGVEYSTQNSFYYTVESENTNFVAVYEYDPVSPAEPEGTASYRLYLNSNVAGSCSFNRTSGAKVKVGDYVSVYVYVNQGYKFLGWYNQEEKVSESTSYGFQMPDGDVTLTAHLEYSPENPADPESAPDQPVTPKIKAKDYTRIYGEANPTFEYTTNTDISGAPVLTCDANETSPAGTYAIKVDRGSVEGENLSLIDGTLTINKAPLTIQGKEYTVKQGDALPVFDLNYIGFKNDETADVLTTLPTVSCTATSDSPEGEYVVTVSGGEAANYDITCTNGKLTITKADTGDETRKLINLSIGSSGTYVDKTRIVFNENASLSYETACDAAKMISSSADYQIYTLDASGVKYSINERPADNGMVPLGIIVNKTGSVSISATKMDCPIVLVDKVLETEYDFSDGDYTFDCNTGTFEDRFVIKKKAADAVAITAKSYTRVYGEANPTFEYTTEGATLNGTPSITCEATATSPVGTYMITIAKGSVTNSEVTYTNGTLTITKAPLTIKTGDYTKKQGEDNPTFTATYEGFKNNETADVLTTKPTITCEATKNSAVGEYTVTVSGAEATNYEISYVNGKLTITEAQAQTPIKLTAKSYTRVYGAANPTFEYTTEGGTLNGTPSITCEATATSPVGTYTITIAKGSVTNSEVTYTNGTLTITKAPLKVSVGNYEIFEGEAIPVFDVKYEGFVNNETADVLTTKPSISCEATNSSPAGEYKVKASGAEAKNYEISYVDGKLTILAKKFEAGGDDNKDEDDTATYQITSQGSGSDTPPTVAITDDKDVADAFAIPETVTYNNKTYKVTEIGEGAFENNTNLKEVSIPSSITSIGDKAFKGCSNLKSITVYITTPISLAVAGTRGAMTRADGNSVFDGVDKATCILYVPEGSVDLYKAAPVWKDFQNILAIGTTGINGIIMNNEPQDIYDLQGRKVRAKSASLEGLPRGIYIINGKKISIK